VGKSTGSSLQSFHGIPVSKASGAVSPAVFAQFPRMREFSWDSRTVFRAEAKLIPADTFNLLVDLTVNTFEESFLDVLSYMECVPDFQPLTTSTSLITYQAALAANSEFPGHC
jgi:hypothetical protein